MSFAIRCVFLLSACTLFAQAGCEELSARRAIQDADQLYHQSKFDEAIDKYQGALAVADLPTGHHNAALANLRVFVPGDKTERNAEYAKQAIHHFTKYLETHPEDLKMTLFLTRIWVDSGDFESAIKYWEGQLAANPGKTEIMSTLAEINKQAGKQDEALGWMYKMIDAEPTKAGKVAGYASLAGIQISRLSSASEVDSKRLAIADKGIAALLTAAEMDPDNKELRGYLSMTYKLRGLAHGAMWARAVDGTSQGFYREEYSKILKRIRAREAAQAGTTPPETKPAVKTEEAQEKANQETEAN